MSNQNESMRNSGAGDIAAAAVTAYNAAANRGRSEVEPPSNTAWVQRSRQQQARLPVRTRLPTAHQPEKKKQESTVAASQTPTDAVAEPLPAAVPGIASIDGPYATTDDTKEDEAFAPPTQNAPGERDSRVAGSAIPEVYPPTPRCGSLDDTDASSKGQKMQRKLERSSMADLPPFPEEVPIEDPCEHRVHVDESRKQRNRATEGMVTGADEIGSQGGDDQAASAITQDVPDIFGDEPTPDQSSPAPQTTPGAVDVPGINSNNDDMEVVNRERPGQGTPQDTASDVEATENSQEATLQATGAHVVNERRRGTRTSNTAANELLREHILAEAPLVSARAVQDPPENPDAHLTSCSPRKYLRRSWAMLASLIAIILTAATLIGVLIPQESTAAGHQEGLQGIQPSAAPSSILTSFPSLLPTFDPETLRFRTIQSMLVPISGLEMLLNTSTPQYRALEWISLIDSLRLPHNTEAERKRVVQRYVLAVLYYACGGQHWTRSNHFLERIHECDWWSWTEFDDKVYAEGALCTKGRKVAVVDYLIMKNNNLTGTLPDELQYLSDLEELDLSDEKIGGPIPGFWGNMTSLTLLHLDSNRHTGAIPSSLGCLTNLEELQLDWNSLTGIIPKSLGNLTNLNSLDLAGNMLTGTIPDSLENLTRLQSLYLHNNLLNGTIPSVLGQLSNPRSLFLHGNRFTGEIPNKICRRHKTGDLWLGVDTLTANGTEFLCECIPVEGLSRCCLLEPDFVGNGYCHPYEPYYTEACNYDNGDCPAACPEGTSPAEGINMSECCVERPWYVGNGVCHLYEPYYTAACGWDGGDCHVEGLPECLGVRPFRLGDGRCDVDEPYNTEACGYDGGDCCESTCQGSKCVENGYNCKDPTVNVTCLNAEGLEGCCVEYPSRIGDGYCHPFEPYYTEACKFDNGDCPKACSEGTSPVAGKNMSGCCVFDPDYIGDGRCHDGYDDYYYYYYESYNTAACGWDGGDCCESTCSGLQCGENGYNCMDPTVNVTCLDADGLEGCCVEYPSKIGDDYCHPYAPYYTESCKFDNGDCPDACPKGTSPVAGKNMSGCCVFDPDYVGDGRCNDGHDDYDYDYEPYNTAACGWDGGDCCEETCVAPWCGRNGYDCKDPTTSNR